MNKFPNRSVSGILRCFPLMLVVLAAYNLLFILSPTDVEGRETAVLTVPLLSGANAVVGWGEILLAGGLILLFLEILKSTRSSRLATLEHILSVLVFIIFLVQFLMVPAAGSTVFALLGLMSLIDVMAGYAISIAAARRDLNIGG